MTPVVLASESSAAAQKWLNVIQQHFPDLDAHIFDPNAAAAASEVRAAIVWKPPAALFARYPDLDLVFNMGAGVDAILRQPGIADTTRIIRLEDAGLANPMTEYVIHYLSGITRNFGVYEQHREKRLWQGAEQTPVQHSTIGVMGLGVIGARIAQALSALDYPVQGWARSPKALPGIRSFHGEDQFASFLASSQFLINVLPLTDQTRNILNRDSLGQLPKGAVLMNIGRGEHLVEEDLLALLDSGHLSQAVLDVAREEPLPHDHPFWTHPAITLTPHISGPTNHFLAIRQIRDKLQDALQGKPVSGEVFRDMGY
ncbi:2-hydroxyacid dehydrogenase [Advenella mimigardefordensis]|uniref:Putative NAD-binding D-isomer specific 2-hydroxyacid dehydrogenase n=1 Tax=Advenella mimigardefordensis (strain DSM 17166 / LMG 22922 / DPN7) TaxID=1247726 RepID=W0PDJ3_ADVMD|nr:glyoxylate/hydroxypyruvate reductase A [Advenella mimigardefordensis]AHG64816.1 putative NAD-binding D-isomer specific 2-hydroxyacid dehydrogenase [Advenella mimigardefordensis DPN7]